MKAEDDISTAKEEKGGGVGRAPDGAAVLQDDLSTFDTEMPVKREDQDSGRVKEEYGTHEAEAGKTSDAADPDVIPRQASAATPSKGKSTKTLRRMSCTSLERESCIVFRC